MTIEVLKKRRATWIRQPSPELLKRREFRLELMRGDCARDQTEIVEFIALHNLITNSTGKNCRVASTQMVTWLHLQAPKSELHLMSPAVNSDCARLESVEKMRVVCNMYSWCNLTYLSLVRSEFSRFFDDPSLAALRNGCGVLSIDFHFVIIIAGVTLWTLPVITNKYAKAWKIMHRETLLFPRMKCTFMEIL